MTQGYLALVLHAHLPYVRHPEHAQFLEEDWFFEAMTETYIPLVHRLNRFPGTPSTSASPFLSRRPFLE